jgi:glutathione peroxidase
MSLYQYQVADAKGQKVSLKDYEGKVVLIVNTATHCGYTKQYEGLQNLYEKFKGKGFEILDFPSNDFFQAPGSNEEIASFCSLKYKTTFKTFGKIHVNGGKADPLYFWLRNHPDGKDVAIRWNFNKFLISKTGEVLQRFDSKVTPEQLEALIAPLV